MKAVGKLLLSIGFIGVILAPLSSSAQLFGAGNLGVPPTPIIAHFGGRIVSIVPCSGGMLHVTVLVNRTGVPLPEFYIWVPFLTDTNLVGPPLPATSIVGGADLPIVCFIGVGFLSTPIPLFGLRMSTIGTSIPSPTLSI